MDTSKTLALRAARNTTVASLVTPAAERLSRPPAPAPARSVVAAPQRVATLAVTARLAPQARAGAQARGRPVIQGAHRDVLLGRPVLIVYNGAGRRHADQLHAQLSQRGWSLSIANRRTPAPRVTTVRYDASAQRLAQALAHSLRIPVKLERCQTRCTGLTILVGEQVAVGPALARPSHKVS
jgi:hypothetical protein